MAVAEHYTVNGGDSGMKVIIPLARMINEEPGVQGSYPTLEIAGKTVLGHLIEQITPLNPEEIIFIVGDNASKTINYVKDNLKTKFRFIQQKQLKGSAHAIYGAKNYVKGELLILFGDTFFEANLKNLSKEKADGIIWVKEVDNPSRLGVVIKDGSLITRLIEKPDEPISHLAMIGLYYFKDSSKLFDSISYILSNNIRTKGSFHLTNAIQLMINKNSMIVTREVDKWVDCDEQTGPFGTVRYLLGKKTLNEGKTDNSIIIKPVYIEKGSVIKNSIIGPNVSVAKGSRIENSVIKESIIGSEARVADAHLAESTIGKKATVTGTYRHILLEDGAKFSSD